MKKIIFAIPTNSSGGAERVLTTLANGFAELGYLVYFVNFDKDSCFYHLNGRVKLIKLNIGFHNCGKIKKLIKVPIVELKRYLAVKKLLKKIKPDVVVAFLKTSEMLFGLASIRLKVPFITSIRNDYGAYKGSLLWFRRWAYPRVKAVVCQTTQVKNSLDSAIACNSLVIPNPIAPEALAEICGIDKIKTKKVIAIGRLDPQKNFALFIDSIYLLVSKHPEYRDIDRGLLGGTDERGSSAGSS